MTINLYDVIVIGAGPAGLVAAESAASTGINVLVLEKKEKVGEKPCGGALTLRSLEGKWIKLSSLGRPIKCVKIVFPNGESRYVDYDEPVITNIDRIKLGSFLAESARHTGAIIKTGAQVVHLDRQNNVWIVSVKEAGEKAGEIRKYKSKSIVGADGIPSLVVRQTKIRRFFTKAEVGFSMQYSFRNGNSSITCDEFYYGHKISPFGYGWIFPHKDHVRVGVGALVRSITTPLRDYLKRFTENYFFERSEFQTPYKFEAALTPLCGIVRPSYDKGVLIVGDAAGHVQPISGEGIAFAIRAGEIAGNIISSAIKHNDFSKESLKKYEREWIRKFGSDLQWGRRLLLYFAKRKKGKSNTNFILRDKKLVKLVADILVNYDSLSKLLIRSVPRLLIRKLL